MRRRERPALLEYAVFGSAFVLSLIVGYYGYKHLTRPQPRAPYVETVPEAAPYETPSDRPELQGSGTVQGVSTIPGVKSETPSRKRK